MASIRKRSTSRGVRYDVRYRDPAGADRTRSFSRKVDADRFAATVESDKVRGLWVDPSAGRVSFREYAEQRWLPAQIHLRPNTLELYEGHLRRHVLPAIGGRPLAAIQRPEVKTLVARLAQNLAPATVATVYAVARMVMQSAVDDGLLAANPCSRVPLPRVERQIVAPPPA